MWADHVDINGWLFMHITGITPENAMLSYLVSNIDHQLGQRKLAPSAEGVRSIYSSR